MANDLEVKKPQIPMEHGILKPVDFEGAWRLACMYADSGLVPKHFAGNPAGIIVAGQFGAELGLSLFPALQNIAVINGSPSVWGDAMPAIVRNSDTLEVFVEYYEGEPGKSNYTAVCIAKRKGVGMDYDPNDDLNTMRKKGLFVNEYSMADATLAGLTGKDNWKHNPRRMLKMRARSFTLRDGWPDKLKGMLSAEEMMDAAQSIELKVKTEKSTGKQTYELPDYSEAYRTDADLIAQFDAAATEAGATRINDFLTAIIDPGMTIDTAKAEIVKANDIINCLANYKKWEAQRAKPNDSKPADGPDLARPENDGQNSEPEKNAPSPVSPGPDLSGSKAPTVEQCLKWCKDSEVMSRYVEDKRVMVMMAARSLNITVFNRKPAEVHAEIREHFKPVPGPVYEDNEESPPTFDQWLSRAYPNIDAAEFGMWLKARSSRSNVPVDSYAEQLMAGGQKSMDLIEAFNQDAANAKMGAAGDDAQF